MQYYIVCPIYDDSKFEFKQYCSKCKSLEKNVQRQVVTEMLESNCMLGSITILICNNLKAKIGKYFALPIVNYELLKKCALLHSLSNLRWFWMWIETILFKMQKLRKKMWNDKP